MHWFRIALSGRLYFKFRISDVFSLDSDFATQKMAYHYYALAATRPLCPALNLYFPTGFYLWSMHYGYRGGNRGSEGEVTSRRSLRSVGSTQMEASGILALWLFSPHSVTQLSTKYTSVSPSAWLWQIPWGERWSHFCTCGIFRILISRKDFICKITHCLLFAECFNVYSMLAYPLLHFE